MKTKFASASSVAMAAVAICLYANPLSAGEVLKISILPGESWFGAVVSCGLDMPWTGSTKGFSRDLRKDSYTNQTSPMLLSDKGRWIWCDDPFAFTVDGGEISIETSGSASVTTGTARGGTLRAAYLFCMESHFRPEGKIPDPMLFSAPQYNTWIELNYHQNQKDLMLYADGIRANGFPPGVPIDQELFVRSAQVHALSPMMQFSVAPWRVLDKEHLALVKAAVDLRQKFAPRILALADECAKSGEPMLRSMEYAFPGNGYSAVKDQFAMGDFLIVAPQIEKGAESREVRLPAGRWLADDGEVFTGPARITVKTPLSRLPHFVAQ